VTRERSSQVRCAFRHTNRYPYDRCLLTAHHPRGALQSNGAVGIFGQSLAKASRRPLQAHARAHRQLAAVCEPVSLAGELRQDSLGSSAPFALGRSGAVALLTLGGCRGAFEDGVEPGFEVLVGVTLAEFIGSLDYLGRLLIAERDGDGPFTKRRWWWVDFPRHQSRT
jgi:hypothetical protein